MKLNRTILIISTRHHCDICKYLQAKSDETTDRLDTITIEIMKARVIRELHNPIEDVKGNVLKRIIDILIAPNNVWNERKKISHRVTE